MTYDTVEDLIAPLYSHPTTILLHECVWLCTCCQSILGRRKVLGQRALAGQSINFPSQVCNALPRPIDESGVVLVPSTSTADGGEGSPSTVPSSSSNTTHSCKRSVRKPKLMR